jgi:hypothetical protein
MFDEPVKMDESSLHNGGDAGDAPSTYHSPADGVVFISESEIARMFGSPSESPVILDDSPTTSSDLSCQGSSTNPISPQKYSSDAEISALFGTEPPVFKRITSVLLR